MDIWPVWFFLLLSNNTKATNRFELAWNEIAQKHQLYGITVIHVLIRYFQIAIEWHHSMMFSFSRSLSLSLSLSLCAQTLWCQPQSDPIKSQKIAVVEKKKAWSIILPDFRVWIVEPKMVAYSQKLYIITYR